MSAQLAAVDFETAGLEARHNTDVPFLYGHVFSDDLNFGSTSLQEIYEYIQDNKIRPIFHNAAFDVGILRTRGYDVPDFEDTMGIAYCIEPDARKSLEHLAFDYLGEHKVESKLFKEYREQLKDPKAFMESDEYPEFEDKLKARCISDTELTYDLFWILMEELETDEDAYNFYYDIERAYIDRIIEMQSNGVCVENTRLVEESNKVANRIKEIKNQIRKIVRRNPKRGVGTKIPEAFNPESKQQVATALKKVYGWEPKSFTKTGQPKVDKKVLANLDYPLAKLMVEYNKWGIYQRNFLLPLSSKQINSIVYGNFNQFRVRTGRLSSSDPNLQNIPGRDDRGASIRQMFIAPEGMDCVVGDLDRIELVFLAFYLEYCLGYTTLADQIRNHVDVHSKNAARWHNVSESSENFREIHRKPCKNGVFALIYGAGVTKFSNTIDVSVERGKELIANDELLVAVAELRKIVVKQATENDGVIHNFFGRRLYVPELLDRDQGIRASGRRKIFNYMIQGSAGDAFKYLQLKAANFSSLLNQIIVVHDEVMYYIDQKWSHLMAEKLTQIYSDPLLLSKDGITIPINCEFNVGENWYLAKGD